MSINFGYGQKVGRRQFILKVWIRCRPLLQSYSITSKRSDHFTLLYSNWYNFNRRSSLTSTPMLEKHFFNPSGFSLLNGHNFSFLNSFLDSRSTAAWLIIVKPVDSRFACPMIITGFWWSKRPKRLFKWLTNTKESIWILKFNYWVLTPSLLPTLEYQSNREEMFPNT